MTLATLHRTAGLLALGLFISTGIYMRVRFPALYEGREAIRFLFRSNHIYLLFAAMVNIAMSLGAVRSTSPVRRPVQAIASGAILIAPAILFAAFFIDPPQPDSDRALSRIGVILTAAGVLAHLICAPRRSPRA